MVERSANGSSSAKRNGVESWKYSGVRLDVVAAETGSVELEKIVEAERRVNGV